MLQRRGQNRLKSHRVYCFRRRRHIVELFFSQPDMAARKANGCPGATELGSRGLSRRGVLMRRLCRT